MTIRPKALTTAIAAALAGMKNLPASALAALQDLNTVGERVARTPGGYTTMTTRQASRNRVAMDKRRARKKRNRKMARRYGGYNA
jgi:hypothetical protein